MKKGIINRFLASVCTAALLGSTLASSVSPLVTYADTTEGDSGASEESSQSEEKPDSDEAEKKAEEEKAAEEARKAEEEAQRKAEEEKKKAEEEAKKAEEEKQKAEEEAKKKAEEEARKKAEEEQARNDQEEAAAKSNAAGESSSLESTSDPEKKQEEGSDAGGSNENAATASDVSEENGKGTAKEEGSGTGSDASTTEDAEKGKTSAAAESSTTESTTSTESASESTTAATGTTEESGSKATTASEEASTSGTTEKAENASTALTEEGGGSATTGTTELKGSGSGSLENTIEQKKEVVVEKEDKTVKVTGRAVADGETISGYNSFGISLGESLRDQAPSIDDYKFTGSVKIDGRSVDRVFNEIVDTKEKDPETGKEVLTKQTRVTKASTSSGSFTLDADTTIEFEYEKEVKDYTNILLKAVYEDTEGNRIPGQQEATISFDDHYDLDAAAPEIADYTYVEARIGNSEALTLGKKTEDNEIFYYYTTWNGGREEEHKLTSDTTVVFQYEKNIVNIEVTATAQDTNGSEIRDYQSFRPFLSEGENDLAKVAPVIKGYTFDHAEIDKKTVEKIEKKVETRRTGKKYTYLADGKALTSDTQILFVYQEDANYTTKLTTETSDGKATVTVSMPESAKIPEGTELKADAISGSRLSVIKSRSSEALDVDKDRLYVQAYDVYFSYQDKDHDSAQRIEPDDTVHVTFNFRKTIASELPKEAKITDSAIVHIHSGEDPVKVDAETKTDGSKGITTASFETEKFSVFAFNYTVEFHYTGYEYVLEGDQSVKLSTVLSALKIDIDTADIENVTFSDPSLVGVRKKGTDWILTAKQAFDTEEKLTVKMASGDTYEVKVTDENERSIKLQDAGSITNIKITRSNGDAVTKDTVVTRNEQLSFELDFSLRSDDIAVKTGNQITGTKTITYTLPDNVDFSQFASQYNGKTITIPGDNGRLGEATFDAATNTISFHVDASYLSSHPNGLKGKLGVFGSLDSTKNKDKTSIPIQFEGYGETITVNTEDTNINGSKTSPTIDKNGEATFTVTFDVSANAKDFYFEDILGSNLDLTESSFKLVNESTNVSYTVKGTKAGKDASGQKTSAKLSLDKQSSMPAGKYTLTYRVKMLNTTLDDNSADGNVVTWHWKGLNEETEKTGTTSGRVTIKQSIPVTKSGSTADAAGYIKWTVYVNRGTNKVNVKDKLFTDTPGAGTSIAIDESHPFTVQEINDSENAVGDPKIITDGSDLISDGKLTYTFTDNKASAYLFTYYTKINDLP